MGQEIVTSRFTKQDFEAFQKRLRDETALLDQWFREGRFRNDRPVGGFEIEAWLIDGQCRPAPVNQQFLELADDLLVTPELARFNVELNSSPVPLRGDFLSRVHAELDSNLHRCNDVAQRLGAELLLTGILPTVREQELTLSNMSDMKRYRALNDQILRYRQGRPMELDIQGREHLHVMHTDVMLESAATALQLHIQVGPDEAVRFYNAARILSAPVVAATANSPYLFGRDLWDESRIPLFEQAISVDGMEVDGRRRRRVGFGRGFARESLFECFQTNLDHYPVLLPAAIDEPMETLPHLRLHNGTIWRWNRPLVGFDDDGVPHLRIEHRPMPAGPSVIDTIANAALFFGLVQVLATAPVAPESLIEFDTARDNFYVAAEQGLDAELVWLDGRTMTAQTLLLDELLPLAYRGLNGLGLSASDSARYLGIIEARVRSGQNGTAWQRRWTAAHGRDMTALTTAYLERQRSGTPVHEWDV